MTNKHVDAFLMPEAEFWAGLRIGDSEPASSFLRTAVRLGKAGRKRDAYRTLGLYHRATASKLITFALEHAGPAAGCTPVEFRKLRLDLDKAHGKAERRHALECLVDQGQRLALHVLRTGDKAPTDLLERMIHGCHSYRATGVFHRYPLGGQLGLYNHFMTLCLSYHALLSLDRLDASTAELALKLMIGAARIVMAKSEHYIVHNIFTAGCYGLFFAARHLPEWREATDWDRRAVSHMALDFSRSFFKDGGHAERNWGYAAHTIGRLTHVYGFGLRTGGLHGREIVFRNGLRRAYRYYSFTMGPNDFCPGFGDEGLRPYSAIFDRALASGVFPKGTPRDLGVDRSRSYLMKPSGFAIMRNGSSPKSAYANLTFGDYAGWHSHQDLLSMNLWAGGRILLEEAPRFGMYENPMDVLWRVDQAHNQLLVDTFVYDCRPLVGEDVYWHSDKHIDYFSAFHRAYRQVPQQEHRTHHNSADLIVRRTVVFVKDPGYLLVLDSVRGEPGSSFNRATAQVWHSPLPFRVLGPGQAVAGHRSAGWSAPMITCRAKRAPPCIHPHSNHGTVFVPGHGCRSYTPVVRVLPRCSSRGRAICRGSPSVPWRPPAGQIGAKASSR